MHRQLGALQDGAGDQRCVVSAPPALKQLTVPDLAILCLRAPRTLEALRPAPGKPRLPARLLVSIALFERIIQEALLVLRNHGRQRRRPMVSLHRRTARYRPRTPRHRLRSQSRAPPRLPLGEHGAGQCQEQPPGHPPRGQRQTPAALPRRLRLALQPPLCPENDPRASRHHSLRQSNGSSRCDRRSDSPQKRRLNIPQV